MGVLWRVLAATGVVACGLSACSVERDNTSPAPVEHERAEVATDRDERAVLAALRELDPCALLDPAAAGWPAATRVYTGPHSCEVNEGQTGQLVRLAAGSAFGADTKLGHFRQQPIDDVKAYVSRQGPDSPTCAVQLPVSFGYAIRFEGVSEPPAEGGTDPCDVAIAFATPAVAKLADPDALAADLPLGDWDVCAVMTDALAAVVDDPDDYTVDQPEGGLGVGECAVTEPGKLGATLGLTFGYDAYPTWSDGKKTVAGQEVWEHERLGCTITWSAGAAGTGDPNRPDQTVELSTGWSGCEVAEQLAAEVITTLAGQPPKPAEPQRPLVYRADEVDLPVAGACGYVTADPDTCEPYVKVVAPQGEDAIAAAAGRDSNVTCAVALDAVRARYGRALTPVTDPSADERGECRFVQRDQAVEVTVTIRPARVDEPDESSPLTVDGHRGWQLRLSAEAYQGQVAFGEHGSVAFWVSGDRTPDRGARLLADILDGR